MLGLSEVIIRWGLMIIIIKVMNVLETSRANNIKITDVFFGY